MPNLPDPIQQPQFYEAVPSKRLLAWVVDTVITLGLSLCVVLATAFVGLFVWPLLFLVTGFAYRYVTLSRGSATWGMQFAGIELRDARGARLGSGTALAHTAGYTISISLPILQIVSVVMMLTSDRGQGLTDAALGTVALNRKAAA
jgi:uncharacterized RDD family membrane protein YckC